MNLKKQIRDLYIYEIVSGLQLVDVVWVFFLIQRGFSLAEVGIAEGVFHIVSMCCEIPSGMLADTIGRRRTLIFSGLFSALSAICMIATDHFLVILAAMGLDAISYNLMSGTREALTYDSLLQDGQEGRYLEISSRQEAIFLGLSALSSLTSIVTVSMGYKGAYLLSALQGLAAACCAGRLTEAKPGTFVPKERMTRGLFWRKMKDHFKGSFRCLREHRAVRKRMAASGGVSAGCYILSMLMQEYLVDLGLNAGYIGIPLFLLYLCSMAGAFFAEKVRGLKTSAVIWAGGSAAGIFIGLSGAGSLLPAVLAAGAAHCMEEMVMIRTDNENQKEFSSEIRATMVSVGSMVYSIFMCFLSPAAGAIAKQFSIPAAFAVLGIFVTVLTWLMTPLYTGTGNPGK